MARSCCGASPGSARPHCWMRSWPRRPGVASSGWRGSSPRWSSRSRACTSCALRSSGRLDRLPTPQQDALGTAFGLRSGGAPDRFLVGLATLGLLSDVAEQQPLVCLVDDTQWLDKASAQVLGFVARRLAGEGVVIVFAIRELADDRDLAGLAAMTLGPLSDADARAVLASAIAGRVDDSVRERIIAEARGNPLALLELPRGWSAAALAGGYGLPDGVSVSGRIEESFRRRASPLSDATKRLLLIAAAEPVGDSSLIWAAARSLGVKPEAADAAVTAGLLGDGADVRFRHPLVRSVVYRDARDDDRRAAHAALADATSATLDPDRRAWHRAQAATGYDDAVASELETSAGRAQARGGAAAAAAFLQRAVALTGDPGRRAQRALAAARASLEAGAFDAARHLLTMAAAGTTGEFERALIDMMSAQVAFASSRGNEATPLLLAAARRLEALDLRFARETYLDTFTAALFGARLNRGIGVAEVADAARAAPRPAPDAIAASDLMLDALIGLSDDYRTAIPACRAALEQVTSDTTSSAERIRWLWQGCVIALEVWDDEHSLQLSQRGVRTARESGTLPELAIALSAYSPVLVLCGDFATAALTVAESRSVEQATGIRAAPYGAMILAAWRGEASLTRHLVEATSQESTARGEGVALAICAYARAVLCNGLGEYEEALSAAVLASEYEEVVVENWGLCELFEPAAKLGRRDVADKALERLAMKAEATGTHWALGILARSRALLSAGDDADARFREALEHLARTRIRSEVARTHLLYGEWLRHVGRRAEAQGRAADGA